MFVLPSTLSCTQYSKVVRPITTIRTQSYTREYSKKDDGKHSSGKTVCTCFSLGSSPETLTFKLLRDTCVMYSSTMGVTPIAAPQHTRWPTVVFSLNGFYFVNMSVGTCRIVLTTDIASSTFRNISVVDETYADLLSLSSGWEST